jgi:hypothetical protein
MERIVKKWLKAVAQVVLEGKMLAVPRLLEELLAAGRWPRNSAEANAQNLKPLVSPERVRRLAPEECTIYLFPSPFQTVRARSKQNPYWYSPMSDPDGIDFDLALDTGDLGLGSDAPILLDYREDVSNPRVIRLWWPGNNKPNRWVVMAQDFQSFVDALGL